MNIFFSNLAKEDKFILRKIAKISVFNMGILKLKLLFLSYLSKVTFFYANTVLWGFFDHFSNGLLGEAYIPGCIQGRSVYLETQ